MRRDAFDYELDEELIAKHPPEERDGARLLVVGDALEHAMVRDLPERLPEGSLVVVNDTRVLPARLLGTKRASGGRVEILLVKKLDEDGARWEAIGRASKPLRPGAMIDFGETLAATIEDKRDDGTLVVKLEAHGTSIAEAIEVTGHVPLPPYMQRDDELADRERYQTVFARAPGAVAAPTAGLHLSTALLDRMRARGVVIASVTLHVGLGTFQPVSAEDLDDHPMHAEVFEVTEATAQAIEAARARRADVVAIGTTVVRALESSADPDRDGLVRAGSGETRLLIQPGYRFRVVDRLLTNFHLPQSTLLAMVAAFAGRERILEAYRAAVASRYRFFSYGDAMLLRRSKEAS